MSSSVLNRRLAKALAALEQVPDPLERLDAVREAREALERLEADTARQARDGGATWSRIGALYGVSKQAAQQRFRVVRAERPLVERVQTAEPSPDEPQQ